MCLILVPLPYEQCQFGRVGEQGELGEQCRDVPWHVWELREQVVGWVSTSLNPTESRAKALTTSGQDCATM
jgi:hypothetical protein